MIATGKRSTVKPTHRYIQGVLFLTAGYGTRAEPLSFCRPKALLPWKKTTLLGRLMDQFAVIDPERMVINSSRCPELVLQEGCRHWNGHTDMKLLFEERPLGLPGTLSRNCKLFEGHWIISNTDMVIDVPVEKMVEYHQRSGSKWTVLTGNFPDYGEYRGLPFNGVSRHYLGVSIVSPEIAALCAAQQLGTGYFTQLRSLAASKGIQINEFFTDAKWLDMGEVHLFRKHLLGQGSYIHQSAMIQDSAILEGFCWVGSSCIISRDTLLRDSVMLEGAVMLQGASLVDGVLPWFSKRS